MSEKANSGEYRRITRHHGEAKALTYAFCAFRYLNQWLRPGEGRVSADG